MKPKWLLQTDIFEENLDILVEEIKRQGMECRIYDYQPFSYCNDIIDEYYDEECVIVYGSLQFGAALNRNRDCTFIPGVYCKLDSFKCSYYYPFFGDTLLNHQYILLPYWDLLRRKDFIFDTLGRKACVFVRPDSGFKNFTGNVIHKQNWEKDVPWLGDYDVDSHTLILVAPYQPVDREWRFVVVDGKIVSGSQYRNASGTKLVEAELDIAAYAQSAVDKAMSAGFTTDRAWCIDICETKESLHVLEIGCFSCAGLYVAPKEPIVREVSRAALEEWLEYR